MNPAAARKLVTRPVRTSLLAALALISGACPAAAAPTRGSTETAPIAARYLWQGAGVVVSDATAFRVDRATIVARNRFRWIAVKIHDALRRVPGNEALLRSEWATTFRRVGIRICGWGVLDRHPVREARLAAAHVRRLDLDCYIADAEDAYMGGAYRGVVARSSIFVRAFRARLPSLPAAVTTYGSAIHPWILPFDYGAWRDHGFALLPQAYLSIAAHYGPAYVATHAIRAGYPGSRVHPMIGVGWPQERRKHWGGDYVWRLIKAETRGFSVFLGETTGERDFDVLGGAIARYGIAR